jgi:hypothetical protein
VVKNANVSPRRLIKLFLIAMGSFVILGLLAVLMMASSPAMSAIGWHIRHGDTVTVEGHIFRVPFSYDVTSNGSNSEIQIARYPGLFDGASWVTVEAKGKVFQTEDALAWQTQVISAVNTAPKPDSRLYPESVHGRQLTFICVRNDLQGVAETLICHAAGTNLGVSTTASNKYRREVREILETSR